MNVKNGRVYTFKYIPVVICFVIMYFALSICAGLIGLDAVVSTILVDAVVSAVGLLCVKYLYGKCNIKGFVFTTPYIIGMTALLIFTWLFSQITATWFLTNFEDTGFDAYQTITDMNPVAYLLLSALVAPIAEEILYRGVVYNSFKQAFPVWLAYILSAFVFAFMHGTLVHMGIGFVCGILFAVVYHYTGSLGFSILLHIIYNSLSLLVGFINVPDFFFKPVVFGIVDVVLICIITIECCRVADAQKYGYHPKAVKQTMPLLDDMYVDGYVQSKLEMICNGEHDDGISIVGVSAIKSTPVPCQHVDDDVDISGCKSYGLGNCYLKNGHCPYDKSE